MAKPSSCAGGSAVRCRAKPTCPIHASAMAMITGSAGATAARVVAITGPTTNDTSSTAPSQAMAAEVNGVRSARCVAACDQRARAMPPTCGLAKPIKAAQPSGTARARPDGT